MTIEARPYGPDTAPAERLELRDRVWRLEDRLFMFVEVPVQMRVEIGSPSMHSGIRVLYYVYKMTLCVIVNSMRPVEKRSRTARTNVETA